MSKLPWGLIVGVMLLAAGVMILGWVAWGVVR